MRNVTTINKPKAPEPRRSKTEGSIYQRDSDLKWVAQLDFGALPDGKRDRRAVVCESRPEAVKAMAGLRAAKDKAKAEKRDVSKGREVFKSYFSRWLNSIAPKVRENTWAGYSGYARNHILPALGHLPIDDIKTSHIQALYDRLIAKGMPMKTLYQIHVLIGGCLRTALPDGVIKRDPTVGTTRTGAIKPKKTAVFTREQAAKMYEVVSNSTSQYRDLCLTIWELGGRTSEAVGLQWKYVHEDYIEIESVLIHTPEGDKDAPPKTDESQRLVFLSATAMARIEQQPRRSKYVFTDSNGKPHRARNWRRQWDSWLCQAFGFTTKGITTAKGIVKQVPVPNVHVTPHSLRHSAAVRLFDQGWTVADVQKRGGWSKTATLQDVYAAHSEEEKQRAMADAARPVFTPKNSVVEETPLPPTEDSASSQQKIEAATHERINALTKWRAVTRDELEELVWSCPAEALAQKFGVSGRAIHKRCEGLGIETPGLGFWAKVRAGKIPHPNGRPVKSSHP